MKNFSVRLTDEEKQQLDDLAATVGISQADLSRQAIRAIINYAEANGGRIHLPFDLNAIPSKDQ